MKNRTLINIAVLAAFFVLVSSKVFAGPEEGKFLNYRLGDIYPVTDSTEIRWSLIPRVILRDAQSFEKIQRIELEITAKTHRIISIAGITEF